jgi:predicted metal-dependent peptidase
MSDIDLSALDEALETVGGVVDKIAADKRASEAMERVEDCRIKAIPERDPARCFFTSLALGLEAAVATDEQIQTAATDGERLLVNPEWVLAKSPEELYGVVIGHEPAHNAMEHFRRGIGMEDQSVANQAMDLEINPLLRRGLRAPPRGNLPRRRQLSKLPARPHDGGILRDSERGAQAGGATGRRARQRPRQVWRLHPSSRPGESRAPGQPVEREGCRRILKPRVDPWEILREYMTRAVKAGDQNWCRPDRRVLSQGLYLPTRRSNELGDVVLLVDTSGSVGDDELALMAGFLEGVLAANPGKLTIIYHHSNVYNVVDWIPEDGPLKLTKDESGGTSHVPAFQEIENRGLDPAVVVALTDLDSRFPPDPGIPTIWVDVEGGHSPPFGKYVDVSV